MPTHDNISITSTTVPDDSATLIVLDSTYGLARTPAAAPGPWRRRWVGPIVKIVIKCGDQDVTLKERVLTGVAGTSADWEDEASGSIAHTANTTKAYEWKPSHGDWQVAVVAGANNPSSLVVKVDVIWGEDYGS